VVASIAAARRDPLATAIRTQGFDLLVLDAPCTPRDTRSATLRLLRSVAPRYALVLTGQLPNNPAALHAVLDLVRPGILEPVQAFSRRWSSLVNSRTRLPSAQLAAVLDAAVVYTDRYAPKPALPRG
jgi:hypothetical protein